ncbi:MAG: hypothetical protein RLZZ324_446, partial [Candidatus Parcubacteria bacterium]
MQKQLQRAASVLAVLSQFVLPDLAASPALAAEVCPLAVNQPYKTPSSSAVYVVTEDCTKRPISNPLVYFSHFMSWNDITVVPASTLATVPDSALSFMPWGPRRTFANGSLVKTVTDPRVWLLVQDRAFPIKDEAAFKELGYSFSQVEDVTPAVLAEYDMQKKDISGASDVPAAVVFKYAGKSEVYVLSFEAGRLVKTKITDMESVSAFGNPGSIAVLPASRTFPNSLYVTAARTYRPRKWYDTTSPTVSFASPAANADISGVTTIVVDASDNVGVTSVKLTVGSKEIGVDTTSPYAIALDTTKFPNGLIYVTATASDAAGNTNHWTRTFTVKNGTVPPPPPADTTPPSVAFSSPLSGAILSGTVSISATATDNVGVTQVVFKNGSAVLAADSAAPYALSLDTAALPNGSLTLAATASDAAGNVSTTTRTFTVSNAVTPPPDTVPPTLSFTSPAAGSSISGTATIAVNAVDDTAVASVQFKNGTTLLATDTIAPYALSLDTTALANGPITITAVASDDAGNATTASRAFTVANVVVPPPDVTAPVVSWITPADGATISGSAHLEVGATDDVGVTSVTFKSGSTVIGTV